MAKFLMMAMSLRKESFNKKLIATAHQILTSEKSNHEFELISFNDFQMPVYDADLETQRGFPDSVKRLAQKVSDVQGIIFSTPEYNGGMPGPFKNAIDWVSRITPMQWPGKHILLLGASPGGLGAIRGLWHSRVPLEAIGVFVYPEMFGLPHANVAFDNSGLLKDTSTNERLKELLMKYSEHVNKA